MSDFAEAVQPHTDGDSDTISSTCVPIILVPGVMGSRIHMFFGRTWDPDTFTSMLVWPSAFSGGKQKTRRALTTSQTSADLLTTFGGVGKSDAAKQIMNNARLAAIGKKAVGGNDDDDDEGDGPADSDIVDYYAGKRNWASVAWGFYGPILIHLESALNPSKNDPDFPVFACGYDWRLSNNDTAATLSAFVDTVLSTTSGRATDVIILTHSMGGLVTRGALAADAGLAAKVRGVVHTVQPSNGAVTCYRRFLTGSSKPLDAAAVAKDKLLNNIMGTTPAQYAYNLSGCPGPLQLLPNHVYAKFFGDNWIRGLDSTFDLGDVYSVYRGSSVPGLSGIVSFGQETCGTSDEIKSGSVLSDFANNLSEAERFHRAIETTAHARTYVLYSNGLSTDDSLTVLDLQGIQQGTISDPNSRPAEQWSVDGDDITDQWNQISYRKLPNGDGTVPAISATCPGMTVLAPTPEAAASALEHSGVFGNAAFNTAVEHYVRRLFSP